MAEWKTEFVIVDGKVQDIRKIDFKNIINFSVSEKCVADEKGSFMEAVKKAKPELGCLHKVTLHIKDEVLVLYKDGAVIKRLHHEFGWKVPEHFKSFNTKSVKDITVIGKDGKYF